MKKFILFSLTILTSLFSQVISAQTKITEKTDPNHFDEKAAIIKAKAKGISSGEITGFIQSQKSEFYSKKGLEKQAHKHTPYENSENVNEQVIYLNGENKPMSIGCPNAGFENYDFSGWSGATGTYSGTAAAPVYSLNSGIVNTAGNNTPLGNTINYQTVVAIPPTNPSYPICAGYDSIACPSGGPLISQIPFVSPYSLDGSSCRMLGAFANYKVSKLKYIMSVTPTNKLFSYSYAVVLNDGHTSQPATHQPYFKVTVKDQNGNPISGCQTFTVDATNATSDTTFRLSHLSYGGNTISYRPWHMVSIDLSSQVHALVTSISIEFEVAGCTAGGHLGYAYVDAECGAGGISASFCSGANAVLTAPTGYINYQWFDNTGSPIAAPTGTNPVLTISSPVVGNTYSVSMSTPGGCTVTLTKTISITSVSILNVNSAPSCAGGNSGIATVDVTGSTGAYSYTWTNINTAQIVSNSQTATGLSPGNYSVVVASPPCGQDSYNFSVGTSPPFYLNQTKSFCGNSTFITQPGGSNYVWYNGTNLIAAPQGNNDTLYIPTATVGDKYTVVYRNAQGCKDSLIYTLSQIAGGNTYFSNTTNVCPNNSNGTTVLNLNTPFSAPYSYIITGPTAANTVSNTTSSATSLTLTSLAPGTYSAVISDGTCIYNNTVTIGTIQTNFTITPTNTVLCFPQPATLIFDFGDVAPSSCGLSTTGACSSPNIIQIGTSTTSGSINNYSPYGGLWESQKNQFLFRASELLAAGISPGKINSLALNVTNTNGNATTFENFTIKLKCVSYNVLNTTSMDNAGLIQVFNPTTVNATTGWNTYNFSQEYDWDGTTNLLVDICFFNPAWDGNLSVEYSNPGYVASKYINADNINQCPLSTVDGSGTERPNIRFGNCGASNPASYTIAVSSNGTITTTFNNDSIRVMPTSTVPPTGTGSVIYTFSVTNPVGGCVATQTLEVLYPPLSTTVTTAISNDSLCEGTSTNLSANGATNYNWYYYQSGAFTPISTSSSITVVPPAIGTNTYMVTGNALCPSSTPDTAFVTVNVIQMANLVVTPLVDVTKCLNKSFIFNASAGPLGQGNTGAPYSYFWTTLPGNAPAPGINSTSGYTVTGNTTTTLVVTVNGACSNSTADTVVVKNFIDDLSVSITNSVITCPNKALTLNSLTTGGYPVYNYYWSVNSTTVSNLSSLDYMSASTGGTYTVGLTVIDSCGYEDFDTDVVIVLPNTLNVSILDSVTACGNTPFTLSSMANGGYPDYNYVWTLNSDVISTNQNLSYTTPSAEGSYSVFVTASDSCGYQNTDVEVINVLPPCMVIIPNVITPNGDNSNEYFKFKNLEYHPNTSVTIFDRWGRKVYENSNYNNEWKAEGVSDGTYFYIVDVPEDKKYSGFVTVFTGK